MFLDAGNYFVACFKIHTGCFITFCHYLNFYETVTKLFFEIPDGIGEEVLAFVAMYVLHQTVCVAF